MRESRARGAKRKGLCLLSKVGVETKRLVARIFTFVANSNPRVHRCTVSSCDIALEPLLLLMGFPAKKLGEEASPRTLLVVVFSLDFLVPCYSSVKYM